MATAVEKQYGSPEADQVRAVNALERDVAIIRMENETIQALAKSTPRDYTAILDDLRQQLDASPRFAKSAIYEKPVGKEPWKCSDCGQQLGYRQRPVQCSSCKSKNIEGGKQVFARGLSVRTAEALASAYGFNRVSTTVSIVDDDHVQVEASFMDYQRGRIWSDSFIVSKWYKTKSGAMQKHADDRFLGVVVKAERSRVVREVITRSVPPGVRAEFEDMVEQRIRGLLTDDEVKKILQAFETKGVTTEMLINFVGRTLAEFTMEDKQRLQGIWTAIRDGETTVEDVFSTKEPQQEAAPATTMDDLINPENVSSDASEPAQDATSPPDKEPPVGPENGQNSGKEKPDTVVKELAATFRKLQDALEMPTRDTTKWLKSLFGEKKGKFMLLTRDEQLEAISQLEAELEIRTGGKPEDENQAQGTLID